MFGNSFGVFVWVVVTTFCLVWFMVNSVVYSIGFSVVSVCC